MVDFAIRLNNTQYLTDLERSQLWKKLTDIVLDKKNYSKDPLTFEKLLLYFLADWAKTLDYDHFGRPSIFTKLMKRLADQAPESLMKEIKREGRTGDIIQTMSMLTACLTTTPPASFQVNLKL